MSCCSAARPTRLPHAIVRRRFDADALADERIGAVRDRPGAGPRRQRARQARRGAGDATTPLVIDGDALHLLDPTRLRDARRADDPDAARGRVRALFGDVGGQQDRPHARRGARQRRDGRLQGRRHRDRAPRRPRRASPPGARLAGDRRHRRRARGRRRGAARRRRAIRSRAACGGGLAARRGRAACRPGVHRRRSCRGAAGRDRACR